MTRCSGILRLRRSVFQSLAFQEMTLAGGGKREIPEETRAIVRHDSRMRKSGSDSTGNLTRNDSVHKRAGRTCETHEPLENVIYREGDVSRALSRMGQSRVHLRSYREFGQRLCDVAALTHFSRTRTHVRPLPDDKVGTFASLRLEDIRESRLIKEHVTYVIISNVIPALHLRISVSFVSLRELIDFTEIFIANYCFSFNRQLSSRLIDCVYKKHCCGVVMVQLNTAQKAESKYRNRIRLERTSQRQSSDTHKTPYDRVKRCLELKINIKASERINRSHPDFCMWETVRTLALTSGLSRGSPVTSTLAFPQLLHPHLISPSSAPSTSMISVYQNPMRVNRGEYGAAPECMSGGKTGVLRETPRTSGLVLHDSHVRDFSEQPTPEIGRVSPRATKREREKESDSGREGQNQANCEEHNRRANESDESGVGEGSPPSALTLSRLHSLMSHPLVHSSHEHLTRHRPAISSRCPNFTSPAHTRQAASVKDCRPLGFDSIYSVLGRHLESSPIRETSRREEVCDASNFRRCRHSRDSTSGKKGGGTEALSASFHEERRARWVSDYGAGQLSRRQLQHGVRRGLCRVPPQFTLYPLQYRTLNFMLHTIRPPPSYHSPPPPQSSFPQQRHHRLMACCAPRRLDDDVLI
ncbi:hypothetical protein PR048_003198 [Dryococelus australis]|uniref:Uncharacterized protein n=1 Tax=Dryococelus australis TaxID=614101 RepID=A0ABQ9IMA9_9NEOP|nr:hypothetical protein PR048_003198 [Dryococelus australis]